MLVFVCFCCVVIPRDATKMQMAFEMGVFFFPIFGSGSVTFSQTLRPVARLQGVQEDVQEQSGPFRRHRVSGRKQKHRRRHRP